MFLALVPGEADVYDPVAGDQSIFGFGSDGRVKSYARESDQVFRKYSGLRRDVFSGRLDILM